MGCDRAFAIAALNAFIWSRVGLALIIDAYFPIELKSFTPPAATQAAMSLVGSVFGCARPGAGTVAVAVEPGGGAVLDELPQAPSPPATPPSGDTRAMP